MPVSSSALCFCYLVEREALLDIPNVYNYQTFVETDKAGYLIRQWVASNLYDRIRCAFILFILALYLLRRSLSQYTAISQFNREEMDRLPTTDGPPRCTGA